jgi:hypothetical protein
MPDSTPYPQLPADFEAAQQQAVQALKAALAAGYQRLQVDLLVPDLKPDVLAYPFHDLFEPPFAFVFADAGAAALAQRNWKQPEWAICSVNQAEQLAAETALIFVAPTVVEVPAVEQLCDSRSANVSTDKATDVPVLALNPQLQDAATVGIGLAGRRLRQRFISTLEPCYFLQSLGSGALLRVYPHPWTTWRLNEADEYEFLAATQTRPTGEDLAKQFASGGMGGLLGGMKRFLRALGN